MTRTESAVIDDSLDPQERKRVLNVLAQRRYRRRRKENHTRIQAILDQVQPQEFDDFGTSSSTEASPATNVQKLQHSELPDGTHLAALNHNATSRTSFPFDLSDFLQEDDVLTMTFPDTYSIAVPELDLLRAARDNATRLHSLSLLFDLNASSIFMTGSYPLDLPDSLQPTSNQLMIPHHPILDILPWPAVRDRLIQMFSIPEQPYSLVGLVYDLEDSGVRIWGDNPAQGTNWEIQQKFLDTWWWALDRSVVQSSDEQRRNRGEPDLILPK